MTVRSCNHAPQRDSFPINEEGSFRALLAAVYWGGACCFTAAEGFHDASIVGSAEYEDLNELVEHDPIRDSRAMEPCGCSSNLGGISASSWYQMGSMMDDGTAGTRNSVD